VTSFVANSLPKRYTPTAIENYTTRTSVDGLSLTLSIVDTGGQESLDSIRPLSYTGSDAILVCFSVINRSSFENAKLNWVHGVKSYMICDSPQIIIVGTKQDLRNEPEILESLAEIGSMPITTKEGEAFARDVDAFAYLECSSLHSVGVTKVFEEAVRAVCTKEHPKKKPPIRKKRGCILL